MSSCQHCDTPITEDQDAVYLNGRCGHRLHLVCYDKRRTVGVSSCCCDGQSSDLGDVLHASVYNPLAAPAGSADSAAATTADTRTGFGGIVDALRKLDSFVESKINQTAGTAIRAGTSVKTLLDTGVDVTAIVKDPGNPLIAPLIQNYSTAEIAGLGFTWDALLAVGLNMQTWDREKWTAARLVADLKITADHLLQGLCAGQASALPGLDLTAAEWQTLCGERERPVRFFQRVGLVATSFLEFDYSLDDWRYQLGLKESPLTAFGLSAEQCWQWLDNSAADKATVKEQFHFLFGTHAPERPGFGAGVDPSESHGGGARAPSGLAAERRATAAPAPSARVGLERAGPPLRPRGSGGNPFRRSTRPGFAHAVGPAARGRGRAGRARQPEEARLVLNLAHVDKADL